MVPLSTSFITRCPFGSVIVFVVLFAAPSCVFYEDLTLFDPPYEEPDAVSDLDIIDIDSNVEAELDADANPDMDGGDERLVTQVEISPAYMTLEVSQTRQLSALAKDIDNAVLRGRSVTWTSSAPSVLQVDSDGLITGKTKGVATVSAKIDGVEGFADITVETPGWAQIHAAGRYTCGLLSNGEAYCWGGNSVNGVLGNGSVDSGSTGEENHDADVNIPTSVSGGIRFESIATGPIHACGWTSAGKAYCWGWGSGGHLGSGVNQDSPVPVEVSGAYQFTDIQIGANHACALEASHHVYCWGHNGELQLGQGADGSTSYNTPKRVLGHTFVALATGRNHNCAISQASLTYCWGKGGLGQLGDGSIVSSPDPVRVDTSQAFVSIVAGDDYTCALNAAGEVYCWGSNEYAVMGEESSTHQLRPVRVGAPHTYEALFAGRGTICGIDAAQELYCWGRNDWGNLGDGSITTNKPSRVLVSGNYRWKSASLSGYHSCGITLDYGGAYCWGQNTRGQSGSGLPQEFFMTPTPVLSP